MVRFGDRLIGDGQPCFITFEAGPTHDGLETAKKLVSLAAEAGADAVKFQILDPDRLVADRTQMMSFDILVDKETGETRTIEEPLYDILCRRSLSFDEWRELKAHSDSLGLAFFATIGFEDEVDLVVQLECDSIKIASADLNHLPLLRRAASTGLCLQLDTGNSTIGEVERAIDIIRAEGNENIIIHQCPSGYPAHLESINLRIIQTLKQLMPYPVAFSDHSPGWNMDIAAVALGANLIEKTITLDRTTPHIEHIMSIEPDEMTAFVKAIHDVEIALGSPRRIMYPEEIERRNQFRRSVYLTRDVGKGQRLRDAIVEFRRPGDGVSPEEYEGMLDQSFRIDLAAGTKLLRHHLV